MEKGVDPVQDPSLLTAGQRVAERFQVIAPLGAGSFGFSYQVKQCDSGKTAALKIARSAQPQFTQAHLRETSLLSHLKHPNISRFLDAGVLPSGHAFLVSEWIEGPTLKQHLSQQGRMSPQDALAVAHALANALNAIHAVGVIHRDLKPENLILPMQGQQVSYQDAVLIDFGVLGTLEQGTDHTVPGEIFGTPRYMAPEQISGLAQTTAVDIYGLGLLFYEMLCGSPLFNQDTLVGMMIAIREGNYDLSQEPVPAAFKRFLGQCLARDPEKRLASASEAGRILEDLELTPAEEDSVVRVARTRNTKDADSAPLPPPALSLSICESDAPTSETVRTIAGARTSSNSNLDATMAFPPTSSAPRARVLPWARILGGLAALLLVLGLAWVLSRHGFSLFTRHWRPLLGILFGVSLVPLTFSVRRFLERHLNHRKLDIEKDAGKVLTGTSSKVDLSATITLAVDEFLARAKKTDERFLAQSLALMVNEYHKADQSSERVATLMNAVTIMEKLTQRMSPWYVRHEKAVSLLVALVGILTGIGTAILNFTKILLSH